MKKIKFKDIVNYKCKKNKDFKVLYTNLADISNLDQEINVTIQSDKSDSNVGTDGYYYDTKIICSHKGYIKHLLDSDYFLLTEVVLSSRERNKDTILEIKGLYDEGGFIIRKKRYIYSKEEKQKRSINMKYLNDNKLVNRKKKGDNIEK